MIQRAQLLSNGGMWYCPTDGQLRGKSVSRYKFAAKVSANNRSRMGNQRVWLDGVSGNGKDARRWRDICRSLAADLGTDLSEAQLTLIRITASTILAAERIQAKIVNNEASTIELQELARLGNLTTRNLLALGAKGTRRKSGLKAYLDAKAKAAVA